MKPILFFLLATLVFSSCNEKDDISKNNKQPVVYVSTLDGSVYNYYGDNSLSTGKNVADTIKLMSGQYANFIIRIEDEYFPGLKKALLVRKDDIFDAVPLFDQNLSYQIHYDFSNSDTIIAIECKNIGNTSFSLNVTDSYGLTTSVFFDVYVLENVKPDAIFQAWNSRGLDPYEITVDASASLDHQEKWGGAIVLYEYYINGDFLTSTEKSLVKYIVPEAGNYKIDVRVKDNEGAWSEYHTGYKSAYITVYD